MTIFSKIAAGEIPSYKCAENEDFYAFLDINPVAKGHTLVIPRREVDYIFDLDDETLAAYHRFAKRVALAIGEAFPCRKVGMAVLGLEVPHAHIHLIPSTMRATWTSANRSSNCLPKKCRRRPMPSARLSNAKTRPNLSTRQFSPLCTSTTLFC